MSFNLYNSETKELTQVAGNGVGGEEYSTNETVIGTWVDGKKLYRKVLEFPRVSAEIDVSYLNIDTLKSISGFGDDANQPQNRVDICYNENAWHYSMYYNKSTKKLKASATSTIINGVIILEYTKTTD